MPEPKWVAVYEIGNDNFATSIYENDYKGLLVARCNQNGQYPEQAAMIIRVLEGDTALRITNLERQLAEAQERLTRLAKKPEQTLYTRGRRQYQRQE